MRFCSLVGRKSLFHEADPYSQVQSLLCPNETASQKSIMFHVLVLLFEIKSGAFSALILKELPSLTEELSLSVTGHLVWCVHYIFSKAVPFLSSLMYLKRSVMSFNF